MEKDNFNIVGVTGSMGEKSNENKADRAGEEEVLENEAPPNKKNKLNVEDRPSDMEIHNEDVDSDEEIVAEGVDSDEAIVQEESAADVELQSEDDVEFLGFSETPKIDLTTIKPSKDIRKEIEMWLTHDPNVRITTCRGLIDALFPNLYYHHNACAVIDTDDQTFLNITIINRTSVAVLFRFFAAKPNGPKCIMDRKLYPFSGTNLTFQSDESKLMRIKTLEFNADGVEVRDFDARYDEFVEEPIGGGMENVTDENELVELQSGILKVKEARPKEKKAEGDAGTMESEQNETKGECDEEYGEEQGGMELM